MEINMKSLALAIALSTLVSAGSALAFDPLARSPEYEARERSEFLHFQKGLPADARASVYSGSRSQVVRSRMEAPAARQNSMYPNTREEQLSGKNY